jgi:hypothetical protein
MECNPGLIQASYYNPIKFVALGAEPVILEINANKT